MGNSEEFQANVPDKAPESSVKQPSKVPLLLARMAVMAAIAVAALVLSNQLDRFIDPNVALCPPGVDASSVSRCIARKAKPDETWLVSLR